MTAITHTRTVQKESVNGRNDQDGENRAEIVRFLRLSSTIRTKGSSSLSIQRHGGGRKMDCAKIARGTP